MRSLDNPVSYEAPTCFKVYLALVPVDRLHTWLLHTGAYWKAFYNLGSLGESDHPTDHTDRSIRVCPSDVGFGVLLWSTALAEATSTLASGED
jgi:hypothetical protein